MGESPNSALSIHCRSDRLMVMNMQHVSELITPEPQTCVSPIQTQYLNASLPFESNDQKQWLRGGGAPASPEPYALPPVVFPYAECASVPNTHRTDRTLGGRSKHAESVVSSIPPKKHHVTRSEAEDYQESVDSNKQMSEIERFEKKQQAREIAQFREKLANPTLMFEE